MEIEWPKKIKMSGLPFMLQGWNCEFYLTSETSDNAPVYRLDPYALYWMIPIIGVKILKYNGNWVLQRDCDDAEFSFIQKVSTGSDYPWGTWSYGAHVMEH